MHRKIMLIFNRVKQINIDLKIGKKIAFYYLLLLFFSLLTSILVNQQIYNGIISRKTIQVSKQTLDSIYINMDSLISNVDLLSHLLIYDTEVQTTLAQEGDDAYIEVVADKNNPMSVRMNDIFIQSSNIASIYLYDLFGHVYYLDKGIKKSLIADDIKNTDLYREVFTKSVPYLVKYNAGGIYNENTTWKHILDNNNISIIRAVNSKETFKPLGLSIMNIPKRALLNNISDMTDKYGMDVLIRDENGNEIIGFNHKYNLDLNGFLKKGEGKDFYSSILKVDKKQYTVSFLKPAKYNWTIIGINPTEAILGDTYSLFLINLIMLLVNSVLIFFIGSFIISKLVTKPIKRLIRSMKKAETGEFKSVSIVAGNNEIGMLRDGYNTMISEIQRLIHSIINEQKLKRKYELGILQEQIKPHFLYNTFDSISSMALSAGNEDIYNLMCALGSYYKNSLSKGSEVITIKQELDIIKNYLIIQSYRYKDLFEMHYDIDEEVLNLNVLKLILQPLVENSIYHGIKPKGDKGDIFIAVYKHENRIYLEVEDNGAGMEEALLKSILTSGSAEAKQSFGIRRTIERLKLFYNTEDVCSIKSEVGMGTHVTLKIPIVKDE